MDVVAIWHVYICQEKNVSAVWMIKIVDMIVASYIMQIGYWLPWCVTCLSMGVDDSFIHGFFNFLFGLAWVKAQYVLTPISISIQDSYNSRFWNHVLHQGYKISRKQVFMI